MDRQIRVSKITEIPAAVERVEAFIAALPKRSGAQICPLICEELLLRLLNAGCPAAHVSVKGGPSARVEITAEGAPAEENRAAADGDGIGAQIGECLLEQYADHFSYRYKNGVNLYRVYVDKRDAIDLTDEIYGFYSDADPEKPGAPTAVLRHIARTDKAAILGKLLEVCSRITEITSVLYVVVADLLYGLKGADKVLLGLITKSIELNTYL